MAETRVGTHLPVISIRRISGHDERPHKTVQHFGCSIAYLTRGEAEVEVGHRVRIAAGSVLMLPAATPHRGLRQQDIEAWSLGFCPSCLGLRLETPGLASIVSIRSGGSPVRTIEPGRRAKVEFLFEGLFDELARDGAQSQELALSWLRLILGEIQRAAPLYPNRSTPDSPLERALTFIEMNALSGISLSDVAQAVHCSPSHLATVVRKRTGQTVGYWINAIRISTAANWLLHSDASLEDIAERVGWQDRTHFTRQFRKFYGQTPAAWRREMQRQVP